LQVVSVTEAVVDLRQILLERNSFLEVSDCLLNQVHLVKGVAKTDMRIHRDLVVLKSGVEVLQGSVMVIGIEKTCAHLN